MGVRISLYAVDESQFGSLVEQPLSSWLEYYSKNGPDTADSLYFIDSARNLYFHSSPQKGVTVHGDGKPVTPLSGHEINSDPFLARKVREVLENDSSIALDIALGRWASCASIDFIKEITSGYRRWWIGSFLKHAKTAPEVSPQDYEVVFAMFRRLLGGYTCGEGITGLNQGPARGDFVIIPEDSAGMTVWTAGEVEHLANLIHSLFNRGMPHFHGIQGKLGIAPETDAEWDEWVHRMLKQLLELEKIKFEMLKVVGFIG